MDTKPVIYILGNLLCALALSMTFPLLVDISDQSSDGSVFGLCILITLFFGGVMVLTTAGHPIHLTTKQGFLMITLSWVVLSLFAALPFWLYSNQSISFTDAFFEATSGITTTGATVFSNLEDLPNGLLIWRAALQWLGGIGIIIMTLSILPFLKVGGMQILQKEFSASEKAMPRATQFAASVGMIYLVLTFVCGFLYWLCGMSAFDSMAHSMTTISTGGFSTYDGSFGHFNDLSLKMICVLFMVIGGTPFILYIKFLSGDVKCLFRDPQLKLFISIIVIVSGFFYVYMRWFYDSGLDSDFSQTVETTFNVTSILTGTGYATQDYQNYGTVAIVIFFVMMTMGACAGSTSCGIKLFRFQVLYSIFIVQIKKLLHPHGVFLPHYSGKPISENVQTSVTSFFFIFAATFALVAIGLAATGVDFVTALSGSASAISNVGPGLGDVIGPTGNYGSLTDAAKWILCFGMLLGRLEIFTVLVLLAPSFWKR